jgi:hypothetical protein
MLLARVVVLVAGLSCLAGAALAAPVTYSFSTGALNTGYFCGGIPLCSPHPWSSFSSGAIVQGSFVYDASVPQTVTGGDGSAIYGGNPSSFSALTGTVDGYSFSDLRGFTQVGNEKFALTDFSASPPVTTMVDFLGLTAEPGLASPNPHNISGFDVGGYTLVNVRMFWFEGGYMPELVPDLTDNQALPAALPSFHGRLALDFVPTGNTNLSYVPASVFFDGLTVTPVPEPETYAMLLAGLGMLGFVARRRRQWQPHAA